MFHAFMAPHSELPLTNHLRKEGFASPQIFLMGPNQLIFLLQSPASFFPLCSSPSQSGICFGERKGQKGNRAHTYRFYNMFISESPIGLICEDGGFSVQGYNINMWCISEMKGSFHTNHIQGTS